MKTYTASKMADALALVKRDLGSDAVILHTRAYKRGGVLGIGAKSVVEITATDDPGASAKRKRVQHRRAPERQPAGPPLQPRSAPDPSAGDLIRRTYAVAQHELAKKQAAAVASNPPPPVPPSPAQAAQPPTPMAAAIPVDQQQLVEEMRTVKRMVREMADQQRRREMVRPKNQKSRGRPDIPDKLFDQYLCLLEQEVAEELAEEVVQQVQDTLNPIELEDESAVRRAALEVIARQIPADGGAGQLQPTDDRRPRTIALVGPTGVGKTTTIAKLAATFKLKQKKNVGLITMDTYRIAAVDQLRTYAHIIGIPLHVVASAHELAGAVRLCAGCDVVLLDTAGRGQRDDPHLEELRTLLGAAKPHEVHLVLSSTCSQSVLMEVVDRFSVVGFDKLIFTKLDEAVSFGVLLNVARKVNKRLSYVTTGQEVPHHIEPGRSERLAALVLGEGARAC